MRANRQTEFGMYMADERDEMLLPRSMVPSALKVGDSLEVFLYRDSEDRPTATTLKPLAQRGEMALMTIREITDFGAFADWGLPKDLLIPKGEMSAPLSAGDQVLVRVLLDHETDRLIGSTKIASSLRKSAEGLKTGQAVDLIVLGRQDRGFAAVVDGQWKGLIYETDVYRPLKTGDRLKGWIKKIRDDQKIDLSLRPVGFLDANKAAREIILQALAQNGGSLPLCDSSPPDEIRRILGLSKKAFKSAIGTLFKERLVEIQETRLILISSP